MKSDLKYTRPGFWIGAAFGSFMGALWFFATQSARETPVATMLLLGSTFVCAAACTLFLRRLAVRMGEE